MKHRIAARWLVWAGAVAAVGLLVLRMGGRTALPAGELLYQEDFHHPDSGWTTWQSTDSEVAYQAGGLHLTVNQPQTDIWSRPVNRYEDVRMEVDAVKISGPARNDYGLICRYQDAENYYALLAGSDGWAAILKVSGGETHLLNTAGENASEVIYPGNQVNHLRADCLGPRLIFSVNGRKVVEARDHDFKEGGVGVIAGTFAEPGVVVRFDHFLVYNP